MENNHLTKHTEQTNNPTGSFFKNLVTAGALIAITLSNIGCTNPNYRKSNLDRVIQNIELCYKDRSSAREYETNKLREAYEKIPMKNGEVDKSQLNGREEDFLSLSKAQRWKVLKIYEENSECNFYSSITNPNKVSDREFLAFYSIFSFKWPL
jgi:hypothetical protein